jgi:hypothetical protein
MKSNTKTLLDHAFGIMQSLKDKKISVDDAKAQADLIKQSNNILKYELDRAVAFQKYETLEIRDIEMR